MYIGRVKAPVDDPLMEGFTSRLEDLNAIADRAPGFVWRLQTNAGNATYFRPYADDRILMNMSVEMLRRRHLWFEKSTGMYLALWWVPAGHRP
jgi:hypothetical protein